MKYKPYTKVIPEESGCLCAIYEPHPFRSSAISEAMGSKVNTGIADDEWVWVYYDWSCNPVGISVGKPDGVEVDKFTTDNLGTLLRVLRRKRCQVPTNLRQMPE